MLDSTSERSTRGVARKSVVVVSVTTCLYILIAEENKPHNMFPMTFSFMEKDLVHFTPSD